MQFSTFVLAALSMGSAIASPVIGVSPFDNARKAVAEAKTNIQQQLVQINVLTNNRSPNAETVTKIQNSLLIIGQSMNGLIAPATALAHAGSAPLSKEQLAAVPQFQNDFQNILINIEAAGKRVTSSNLNKASVAQVKPQLQWTLATVGPVSQPIIYYINTYAPKYATYKTWIPYIVNIEALIVVVLGPVAVALGIDISIL